jgi:hypothetical protein
MAKTITYSESSQLRDLAEKLKTRYYSVIGFVDIESIFFAFKGGDISEDFRYEVLGLKNDWVRHAHNSEIEKLYCISFSFEFYQKAEGPLLEWSLFECLYACGIKRDGKLRRKDVHEYSRILNTLEELGQKKDWRNNLHLPELLGEETIFFGVEEDNDVI